MVSSIFASLLWVQVYAGRTVEKAVRVVSLGHDTVCQHMRTLILDSCRVTHPMSTCRSRRMVSLV